MHPAAHHNLLCSSRNNTFARFYVVDRKISQQRRSIIVHKHSFKIIIFPKELSEANNYSWMQQSMLDSELRKSSTEYTESLSRPRTR